MTLTRRIKTLSRLLLLGLLLFPLSGLADDDALLRVANQKSRLKILFQASNALLGAPYRVEFSDFATSAPLTEALNADAVDIGWIGDAPLVFAAGAGVPLKAVAAVKSEATSVAIIAPGDSKLRDAQSLAGKRIATTRGSIGHYLTIAALRSAGLKPDAVRFVFLAPGDARGLLLNGQVDAWATWDPYTTISQTQDHTKVVVDGKGLFPGHSFLVASDSAIGRKRELLRDFLARLQQALLWAQQNPEPYAAAQARVSGLPKDVVLVSDKRAQAHLINIDNGVVSALQTTADLYAEAGVVKQPVNATRIFDRSFNRP